MGWTISTLAYGDPPQKRYEDGRETTNWNCSLALLADSQYQRLQCEEALTLENLESVISEVNQDNDPAFLMRGQPVNQNDDNTFNLDETCWIDAPSRQHQLDLDFTHLSIYPESDLSSRLDVVREVLPFLKDKRMLVSLSSGAGLPKIGNKDYPKRISLRLWIETPRAYTGEELAFCYGDYIKAGLIDGGMFQPTRRHYILKPKLINTLCGLRSATPWMMLEDGALLNPESLKRQSFTPEKTKRSSKKTKTSSNKTDSDKLARLNKIKKVWSATGKEDYPEQIDLLARNIGFDGIRNDLFAWLFRREAFFNSGDTAPLIAAILESEFARGDRTERNLKAWEKTESKKVLQKLRRDAQNWALKNPDRAFLFEEIDLANCDWSDLKNVRAALIISGTGTNKTKGVVYDLIGDAKKENRPTLVLSPLIAVTEDIAAKCDIRHYHSLGTKPHQKREVMLNSQYLATCYQSLHYYEKLGEIPEFDTVILDEAAQIFRGQGDTKESAHWVDWVYKVCDKANHVYALDADADEHTIWCLQQIENYQAENFSLYLNSAEWGKDYEIHQFDDYGTILAELIQDIDKGKKVVIAMDCSESNGSLTGFAKFLEEKCEGKKVRAYDSKTVNRDARELKTEANKTIVGWWDEMDALIISPWAAVGWDYLDEKHIFDEIYVITINQFISAQKMWQWIRRFRLSRSAKVYNRSKSDAPFDSAVMRVVEREKTKKEADLTRIEAWQIKTQEAKDLDLANVNWYFRSKCEDRGANLTFRIATDEEKDENVLLVEELKDVRAEVRALLIDQERTEEEARLKILSSFRYFVEDIGFKKLDDDIHGDDAALFKELRYRDSKINAAKAERFCRIIHADEEERAFYDSKEIIEFNVALGRLFDGFWRAMDGLIDLKKFETIAHWYYQGANTEIYATFDDIDFDDLNKILKRHYPAIKNEISGIGKDAFLEPQRVLRPLVRSLDLGFTTEFKIKNKQQRPSATEAKNALFEHYKKTESKFPKRALKHVKTSWALKFCQKKQKEGVELHKLEKQFLESRPNALKIFRKEYVSAAWLGNMKNAVQSYDDRNGYSQNHTKYCACDLCHKENTRLKTALTSNSPKKNIHL
mgnify:CR=1 FL=1